MTLRQIVRGICSECQKPFESNRERFTCGPKCTRLRRLRLGPSKGGGRTPSCRRAGRGGRQAAWRTRKMMREWTGRRR